MKNLQHQYFYANQQTLELFGCNAEQLVGKDVNDFFPPSTVEQLNAVDKLVFAGKNTKEEISVIHSSGDRRFYLEVKTPLYDDLNNGAIIGLCGISTDITDRKLMEIELENHAHTDFLTGLFNRRFFYELAEKELERVKRYHKPLSLLMLDIDNFKRINDNYGHNIGDIVLKKLAEICISTIREIDIAGRLGGEEFGIVLPETQIDDAVEVAERLRKTVESAIMQIDEEILFRFTISIGAANLTGNHKNLDELMIAADKAMYFAKANGKNKVLRNLG